MAQSKTKKLAKTKADKYFSKFIHQRDTYYGGIGKCITCGAFKHGSNLDCGHFISRRFEATRYDERNAHLQCKRCNRFEHGNQFEHGVAIDRIYGDGTAEKIRLKSKMKCRRKKQDYEFIAQEYKDKLDNLKISLN
jgi:hypothetical protein